eukprot:354036-Chlamydomonas_euryale.AAC.2
MGARHAAWRRPASLSRACAEGAQLSGPPVSPRELGSTIWNGFHRGISIIGVLASVSVSSALISARSFGTAAIRG